MISCSHRSFLDTYALFYKWRCTSHQTQPFSCLLRWQVHLIIECYYSLATNSIHERDAATNYIHLRARRKCPPSRRIEISARRFLPAQTVHKPRLWLKCMWTETSSMCLELSRSRTRNHIKFADVFNQVHLLTARGAVLFAWKNPDHSILVPIWKIRLWVRREPGPYRWDYACKTLASYR